MGPALWVLPGLLVSCGGGDGLLAPPTTPSESLTPSPFPAGDRQPERADRAARHPACCSSTAHSRRHDMTSDPHPDHLDCPGAESGRRAQPRPEPGIGEPGHRADLRLPRSRRSEQRQPAWQHHHPLTATGVTPCTTTSKVSGASSGATETLPVINPGDRRRAGTDAAVASRGGRPGGAGRRPRRFPRWRACRSASASSICSG